MKHRWMCLAVLAAAGILARSGATQAPPTASLDELRQDLRAPRPEKRRSAVKKLAALATRESFELVLGALDDPDGQVADEAQLAVGRVSDSRLAALLVGSAGIHARDEWVQLRACEALGRIECAFDARRLSNCLSARDPELARTALWTIERQAQARRLTRDDDQAVEKWLDVLSARVRGAGPAEVRGAALLALLRIDALAAQALAVAVLDDKAEGLRCAALQVVATQSEQESLTHSTRALSDASFRVRSVAVDNLKRLKSRASVTALIERLGVEPRARLKGEILVFLRDSSGQDHGLDLEAWRAWADTLKGPWSTGGTERSTPFGGDTHVKLAGFELVSDRVTFLIDLSGSMWDTEEGGQTRKQLVDVKLRACLEALPATAEFNLIPYTRVAIPWEKRLVRASKDNVARAARWFESRNDRGPGNVYDAILLALEDPEVDTLVILTDGVPTGGRRWNLELMVELLVERNRYLQVAFDSILVDAPKGNRRVWADLAERTGGRSKALEVSDLQGEGVARGPPR
ncbi:MAG: hypothetical protein JNL28_11225 [Planctomycetes bacterium]|nr:hypothetical protein [Planctomycetota bacterium]